MRMFLTLDHLANFQSEKQRRGYETLVCQFFVLAVLIGTLVGSGVRAQNGNAVVFKAPGPFIAGDARFPAGTYTIRQDQDNLQEWEISNDSEAYAAFLSTEQVDVPASSQKTEVTFHKYGSTLVLKEISIGGLRTGYTVQTTYAEKRPPRVDNQPRSRCPRRRSKA
jgi:hypothetical protein